MLERAFREQGGFCAACCEPMILLPPAKWLRDNGYMDRKCGRMIRKIALPSGSIATIEHLVPISKGGKNRPSNTVATHWSCNHRRGLIEWHTFLELVATLQSEALDRECKRLNGDLQYGSRCDKMPKREARKRFWKLMKIQAETLQLDWPEVPTFEVLWAGLTGAPPALICPGMRDL
jgi:hypothetical protein